MLKRETECGKWKNGKMEKWKNGKMEKRKMEKWKNGKNGKWKKWKNGKMEKWKNNALRFVEQIYFATVSDSRKSFKGRKEDKEE